MERAERFRTSLTDEGRYRLLVEAITDYAIYMLDPDGLVASWNAGAQRFKGYEASEILGQHFSRFYTEEDRQAGRPDRALEIATREGKFESEGWRVRKDGSRFWAHVVIDPVRATSGEIVGFAKITRDITEHKLAKEALRRSEDQFRRLVQGVADYAIYMLDTDGQVTSWNSGAQRIKGYGPDEIIGEHFSRFYTEEDRKAGEPQRGLDIAARDGRFEKEGWRVRKDGTHFRANVVIDAIRDDGGTLLGFAKVTRDVTEQHAAQRAIAEARESLFQAQKMDAMGQLTGGIAHDFNNLLMAILGSLEPLRKRLPDDPKMRSLLDNAVQGAQRGVSLTKRLLAFARRQELKLEPIDVPTLVRGMTSLLKRSLAPSITIETRFPLGLRKVRADANQLETALLNLAVNARDAMQEGGAITMAAQEENVAPGHDTNLMPGRYVRLSVSDTGEGMDEATLARAAEPFFTTKGVGKGTGLGLPMVHGLAEQSGGRLILKSRKGEGTTAELWLPSIEEELKAVSHAPQPAGQRSERSTRSLVVLAVDDDFLVLMSTTAMLEEQGHTVIEAASGRQALDILRREQTVDLVITDQAMPQMTGAQLVEAIRVEWPELPIVLATGYAELPPGTDPDLPKLTKPFQEHDLAEIIADAIRPKPATGRALDGRVR
jgi:PAS domain S-box-containing protein